MVILVKENKNMGRLHQKKSLNFEFMNYSGYRRNYENENIKIYSISGKAHHNSDLSLEEISSYLSSNLATFNNPQKVLSAQYLINLIESRSNNSSYSRNPVSEEMLNHPFVNQLLTALESYKSYADQKKAIPGYYYCDTVSDKGFSLRVFSMESTLPTKSISLLSITKGSESITFLSAEKYRKYLNHKDQSDIENWINFIQINLKAPIKSKGFDGRVNIPISIVQHHKEGLVKAIIPLI